MPDRAILPMLSSLRNTDAVTTGELSFLFVRKTMRIKKQERRRGREREREKGRVRESGVRSRARRIWEEEKER